MGMGNVRGQCFQNMLRAIILCCLEIKKTEGHIQNPQVKGKLRFCFEMKEKTKMLMMVSL